MRQKYSDRRQFLISASRFCFVAAIGASGAVMWPSSAFADAALDSYRANGVIAERFDGYLELRDGGAPGAARRLVADVNTKRRALYEKRAGEQGVPVTEVGKIFAAKIFETAPKGTFFRQPSGGYVRK